MRALEASARELAASDVVALRRDPGLLAGIEMAGGLQIPMPEVLADDADAVQFRHLAAELYLREDPNRCPDQEAVGGFIAATPIQLKG